MSVEGFLQDLGLPINADFDSVEQKFLDAVKERIQSVAENYDEAEVKAEEDNLRAFHRDFFQYTLEWGKKELIANKDKPNHPNAGKLKAEAREVIESTHNLITDFACCYMHINRFSTLLRDEIRKEEGRLGVGPKNIRWTADAGIMIGRYKKQKTDMIAQNTRMLSARDALLQIEEHMEATKGALIALLGNEKGEKFARSLTSALRTSNFEKAQKTLKEVENTKKKFSIDQKGTAQHQDIISKAGMRLIETVRLNVENITSPDSKLYLRVSETEIAYNNNVQELRKIKAFLAKYQLPYMQYKLDMLSHLKDKLMVVGSLDSLMILYKKLISGMVQPLNDIKSLREYESDVVGHSKYLIQGLYDEIPKIRQRAEETVQEFRQNCAEFQEVEQLELDEVAITDDGDSAQASG